MADSITSVAGSSATTRRSRLLELALVFSKLGATAFGGPAAHVWGYVLLAFLRTDLVQRLGWLSEGQLLDAVAAGQVTPGPL